jgi:hypothetical protein
MSYYLHTFTGLSNFRLNKIHRFVMIVSETGFRLRLQVERTQLGPMSPETENVFI